MTTQSNIRAAIERSSSHNEIVNVTIEGDASDALEACRDIFDGHVDHYVDIEDNSMDLWGWTAATAADCMEWRLLIRFDDQRDS